MGRSSHMTLTIQRRRSTSRRLVSRGLRSPCPGRRAPTTPTTTDTGRTRAATPSRSVSSIPAGGCPRACPSITLTGQPARSATSSPWESTLTTLVRESRVATSLAGTCIRSSATTAASVRVRLALVSTGGFTRSNCRRGSGLPSRTRAALPRTRAPSSSTWRWGIRSLVERVMLRSSRRPTSLAGISVTGAVMLTPNG